MAVELSERVVVTTCLDRLSVVHIGLMLGLPHLDRILAGLSMGCVAGGVREDESVPQFGLLSRTRVGRM